MNLHVEVTGSGAPLVMLHGWGMHGGVWSDTAELAADFQVHNVDLPGHGESSTIHFPPTREVAIAPSPPRGRVGEGEHPGRKQHPLPNPPPRGEGTGLAGHHSG